MLVICWKSTVAVTAIAAAIVARVSSKSSNTSRGNSSSKIRSKGSSNNSSTSRNSTVPCSRCDVRGGRPLLGIPPDGSTLCNGPLPSGHSTLTLDFGIFCIILRFSFFLCLFIILNTRFLRFVPLANERTAPKTKS